MALSATVALVGTPSAELFEVTLDGAQRVAVQPAGVAISAGAVDQSGRLWFGDRQGSLWRGVLRGALSLELVATSTMGGIDVLAVGELAGGEVEAFAVVRPGTLIRFDGSAWAGLHDMCRTELCTDKYGYRLQRLGPGEAVAMRFKAVKMVHHREGRTIELAIPHTDPSSLHARCLENVAGFGIAVGIEGQVLRFDPAADAWQDELVVLPGFDVYSVASFRGAFVLGGDAGAVTSFVDGVACPSQFVAGGSVIRLLPLAGALLAVGEPAQGGSNIVPLTVLHAF